MILILAAPLPAALTAAVSREYRQLEGGLSNGRSVAVRSSATAEDLPDASFAGQQETFLNVSGLDQVIAKIKEVFASLFNDRAIAYRVHRGYDHRDVALSTAVQQMVRSDVGASGVMFTLDTESGFEDVVFVTSNYGLGETVVQGIVNPDEFYVYKPALAAGRPSVIRKTMGSKTTRMIFAPGGVVTTDVPEAERDQFSLSDAEVEELARHAIVIEQHYGRPMDIEWAKDGEEGGLYIVQARPGDRTKPCRQKAANAMS